MLLRSSFFRSNLLQSVPGSFRTFCQLSKSTSLFSQLHRFPCKKSVLYFSKYRRRTIAYKEPSIYAQLKTPFIFTVATGTACIFGVKYMEKERLLQPKHSEPCSEWWCSEWFKAVFPIGMSCLVVFTAYRLSFLTADKYPAFLKFMDRFFANKAKPVSAIEACIQMVTPSISHCSLVHLSVNMYIFYCIGKEFVPEIGKEKFLSWFFFSSVISNFVSMSYMVTLGHTNGALGASGAVLGLLAGLAHRHPELQFHIIFLPMIKFSGTTLIGGLLVFDLLGALGLLGRLGRAFPLDHAGHLGGVLSGLAFSYITKEKQQN